MRPHPRCGNNEAIGLESDDEIIAVALHRYLPPIFHETIPVHGFKRGGAKVVPIGGRWNRSVAAAQGGCRPAHMGEMLEFLPCSKAGAG
jgi:hypothetical protein